MTILLMIALELLSPSTSAAAVPNRWVCVLRHSPETNNPIYISLREPTVTEIRYHDNPDGSLRMTQHPLIAEETITQWQESRATCQTTRLFRDGNRGRVFDFTFVCRDVEGSFSLDFGTRTAQYTEARVRWPRRSRQLNFTGCYATAW